MSNLNPNEKVKLEKLFSMNAGYVLNFSDRTFRDFFAELGVDIDLNIYNSNGSSKANRLRAFWRIEKSKTLVGATIKNMIQHGQAYNLFNEHDSILIEGCQIIYTRLLAGETVSDLNVLTDTMREHDFEFIATQVQEAIEKHQPGSVLDRLHTFMIRFIRSLCNKRGIKTKEEPLHSIFGKYIKYLEQNKHVKSDMTTRILKVHISILDSFNDVRNKESPAHDNKILNYHESILIFNNISSIVKFIKSIENNIQEINLEAKNPF